MNSKNFLTTPLQRQLSRAAFVFLFIVAVLGFMDATYLTIEHYSNVIPPCSIGSCETVLSSSWATVGGVPVALAGAVYYLFILVLLMVYRDGKNEKVLRATLVFTVLGMIATIYFVALQLFVLHAICIYCMGSAITSTTLFISALVILKKYRAPLIPQ
jgi:uncharacterized membrane protein